MKGKLFFTLLVFLLSMSASYASFPVVRTVKAASFPVVRTAEANTETITDNSESVLLAAPALRASKDMWVAVAFWFFLGGFAAHRWYLGSPVGWNILFILTLGGLGVWAIVDLINILTRNWDGL
ncbi:NINE protein [Flavobacteriaceae bacterium AU392]|nr:TM2 domain-containing protein [Flavobacteriaceae bacterium]RKM85762.1 NINE protein [Flavobacteriaceae bacterium AU392]